MIPNIAIRRSSSGLSVFRTLLALLAASVATALAWPAGAAAGTPLYPDLRMLSPTSFSLHVADVGGEQHYRIHFVTVPWNAGQGALEVQRIPTPSGIADLKQRIYESPAGFHDESLGAMVFDPLDFFFNIPDIARYEVWSERAYQRAQARGFRRGQPLFVRDSVSHCVADIIHVEDAAGPPAEVYRSCTKVMTGLSVGWGDIEDRDLAVQSVDFGTTMPPDGDYVLRVIVDPQNLLFESPGKADPARESEVANSAIAYFRLAQGQIAGIE